MRVTGLVVSLGSVIERTKTLIILSFTCAPEYHDAQHVCWPPSSGCAEQAR